METVAKSLSDLMALIVSFSSGLSSWLPMRLLAYTVALIALGILIILLVRYFSGESEDIDLSDMDNDVE